MNMRHLPSNEKKAEPFNAPFAFYPNAVESDQKKTIDAMDAYPELWKYSIENTELFWDTQAQMIPWIKPYKNILKRNDENDFVGSWFDQGRLNATDVCIDRWVKDHGDKTALIWVSEEDTGIVPKTRVFTYKDLSDYINQVANLLKSCGVRRGSRVGIWMPMIPEVIVTQFACAKIGAVSVVVFSGFSAANAEQRFEAAGCEVIVTADGGRRKGKDFVLRNLLSTEFIESPTVSKIITYQNLSLPYSTTLKDLSWNEPVSSMPTCCDPEPMDAEDPLFLLYTSGTTGKPKGILHSTAGYLIYAMSTMKHVWDINGLLPSQEEREREVWFCTADVGWITGHSYLTYAPFALGTTVILYEGVPTYPRPDRFFALIDRYKVTHFYTSPTLLRQLSSYKDTYSSKYALDSLKVLGTVGEPIDPTTWQWFYEQVGKSRCPIVDTYWQTETGGYVLSPVAGKTKLKPGSCGGPFFSIQPKILREDCTETDIGEKGYLCICHPWPGMMRTIFQDHDRFTKDYLKRFPGYYFTGDEAYKDADGYIWIAGRADDVIKVSGHRLGTAELEAAVNSFPGVVESGAIAIPDEIKGSSIVMFVVGEKPILFSEIKDHVKKILGPVAVPDTVYFVPDLPKTRSGKIVRRLLRNILLKEKISETSTLINSELVEELYRILHK